MKKRVFLSIVLIIWGTIGLFVLIHLAVAGEREDLQQAFQQRQTALGQANTQIQAQQAVIDAGVRQITDAQNRKDQAAGQLNQLQMEMGAIQRRLMELERPPVEQPGK
jgi:peptidoglycan hydrolase CwlO-like protein